MSERSLYDVLGKGGESLGDWSSTGQSKFDSEILSSAFSENSRSDYHFLVDRQVVELEGNCITGQRHELYYLLSIEDRAEISRCDASSIHSYVD